MLYTKPVAYNAPRVQSLPPLLRKRFQHRHRQALIFSEILMQAGVPAVQHLPGRRSQPLAAKQGLRFSVRKERLTIWGVASLLRVKHSAGPPTWLQVAPLAVLVAYPAASGP